MSYRVAMREAIMIAMAATVALLGFGCGGSLTRDDAGATGMGGAGGRGGAGGDGDAAQMTDGGSDQRTCTALCGRVEKAVRTESCMFALGCSLSGDFTGLAVLVDGQAVPRDASRVEGWDYTDESMSAFELFGQICTAALNDVASVEVAYLCELP